MQPGFGDAARGLFTPGRGWDTGCPPAHGYIAATILWRKDMLFNKADRTSLSRRRCRGAHLNSTTKGWDDSSPQAASTTGGRWGRAVLAQPPPPCCHEALVGLSRCALCRVCSVLLTLALAAGLVRQAGPNLHSSTLATRGLPERYTLTMLPFREATLSYRVSPMAFGSTTWLIRRIRSL